VTALYPVVFVLTSAMSSTGPTPQASLWQQRHATPE